MKITFRLEDTLADRAQEIPDDHSERNGLITDQATAVLSVLTDGRHVSLMTKSRRCRTKPAGQLAG